MIDRFDATRVVDVHDGVSGKDDEVRGVVGCDEADIEFGIEHADQTAGLSRCYGDGLEWGESGGDEVFELTVLAESGDAAGSSAGVCAEGYAYACVVEGLEVLERNCMILLGLFGLCCRECDGGVVGGLQSGEELRAGGLLEELCLHHFWIRGVEVEGFVERKSGDVPGIALKQRLDEGLVDGLVADGMSEDVDVVVDELASVGEGVDVSGDVKMALMGFFDDGGVDGWIHCGGAAVEWIDPDFDDVGAVRGEVVHVAAGFVGGGGAVDLIGRYGEGRGAVGDADSAACGEDGGSAEFAGVLLVAEIVDEIAVQSEADDGRDAVALELIECGGDVFSGVGVR